jgi:hypothetical protein
VSHTFAKAVGHRIVNMDQHNRDLGRGGLRCARRLVLEGDDQVYPIANPLFGQRIGGVFVRQIAPIELNIFPLFVTSLFQFLAQRLQRRRHMIQADVRKADAPDLRRLLRLDE